MNSDRSKEKAQEEADKINPDTGMKENPDGTKTDPQTGKLAEDESDDGGPKKEGLQSKKARAKK